MRHPLVFLSVISMCGCSVYDPALLDQAVGGEGEGAASGDGDGDVSGDGDGDGDGVGGSATGGDSGDGDLGNAGGAGSGGDASGGGDGTGGTPGGTGGFPVGIESIMDDFTPPAAYINDIEGRHGAWAVYNDETATGTMSPGYGDPFTTEPKDGDINNQALHITAQGFVVWGAGLYVSINSLSGTPEPYDLVARGYDAVRFIAKRGEATAHSVLKLAMADEYSTTAGSCAEICTQDHPTSQVLLTDEWAEHTILFDDMYRKDLPTPPDFSAIYEFHLNMDSDNIDFWVDDIRFVDLD